ncbi:MAG TPA: hypothetical protein EYQ47_08210 [Cycloclasticus sp.]|jgi:hypothetical protein|nr:hypothetical protein [Cycloclasticus sp.]
MQTSRFLILTLLSLVFNSAVIYAENHLGKEQEIDWYSVEYIIFENNPLSNQALEPWTKEPFEMPIDAIELDSPSDNDSDQSNLSADYKEPDSPLISIQLDSPSDGDSNQSNLSADFKEPDSPLISKAFSPLNIDQQQLHGVVTRLDKQSSYTPIVHGGWIQPLEEKSPLQAIQIVQQAGAIQLEGTLTFHRGRYLHLDVDLQLTEMMPATFNDSYLSSVALQPATIYRLKETRRIKTSDTHYFDHPRFGVIAIVEKIDFPEAPVSTSDLIQEQHIEAIELVQPNPSQLNEN